MCPSFTLHLDQDSTPELSYEECLHIVKGLESVRRCKLTGSPIIEWAARFMQQNRIRYLSSLNQFIEEVASNSHLRYLVCNLSLNDSVEEVGNDT
jgi:hypothetical protein